jgi:MFS family permease
MMKVVFQKVILTLLYLTPIGYFLRMIDLQTGYESSGIYVRLPYRAPLHAFVKQNPLFTERVQWIFNGVFLLLQAFFVVWKQLGDEFGAAYAWLAAIFGVVSIISAFSPKFDWNKKLVTLRITYFETVVVLMLILCVVQFRK